MVASWLVEAAASYNRASLEKRDSYSAFVVLPVRHLETILNWAFEALPDEILIGFDPLQSMPIEAEIIETCKGMDHRDDLFAGQAFVIGEPHLVNRGDSFSVHHVPEEWVDELFAVDRGSRGARFTHWMILGIEFSPEGPFPWFEDAEGVRRPLKPEDAEPKRGWGSWRSRQRKTVLGRASTGHSIHGLELIAFHRTGVGINVLFVDDDARLIT